MTLVSIEVQGRRHRLTAKGHAGDIEACNYITGVLYSLAGFASNEAKRGNTELLQLRMEPGDVVIEAKGGERMETAFEMACVGLLQLRLQRPAAVQVEIVDH